MLGPERFGAAVAAAKLREPVSVLSASSLSLDAVGGGVPDGLRPAQLAPVAIGQGELQLTPLAVAMLTAAVADDGVMLAPTLSPTAKPVLRARPFSYAAAGRVKKMMRAVVRTGTGTACDLPGLTVCGKTGTAETGRGKDHAWFTCFAPMEAPGLVVTVLVEHGGFGAAAALPIARELLKTAQGLGDVKGEG
jgi:cell division protein FtsI/penicillin-binding protein 2